MDARREYVELVEAIGLGFHPDTRVDEYQPPLPPEIAAKYERVVEAAFGSFDPYEVGCQVFERIQKQAWRL